MIANRPNAAVLVRRQGFTIGANLARKAGRLPRHLVCFRAAILTCASVLSCPNHDRYEGQEGDHRNQHWLLHLLSSLGEGTYLGNEGTVGQPRFASILRPFPTPKQ